MVESVVGGASMADGKEKLPTEVMKDIRKDVMKDVIKEPTERQTFMCGMANNDVMKDVLITASTLVEP